MEKDLFGKKVVKKKSMLEKAIEKYDRNSFKDRLKRLKYLNEVFPKGYSFLSDIETAYIFDETKMAFINGEFIATLMLSQAYIERKLQNYFSSIGLATEAKRGIKYIISYARKHGLIDEFLLDKIDLLRKKRNPFSHLKPYEYEFNISHRLKKEMKEPLLIIEKDAHEAISLMYHISISDFKKATFT